MFKAFQDTVTYVAGGVSWALGLSSSKETEEGRDFASKKPEPQKQKKKKRNRGSKKQKRPTTLAQTPAPSHKRAAPYRPQGPFGALYIEDSSEDESVDESFNANEQSERAEKPYLYHATATLSLAPTELPQAHILTEEPEHTETQSASTSLSEKEDSDSEEEENKESYDASSLGETTVETTRPKTEDYDSGELTPHAVLETDLALPLLQLADFILALTHHPLVLTGGAVTSLYLKESLDKINDYDCLVFFFSCEALREALIKHGLSDEACKIIGDDHPVVNIRLTHEGESLSIDLNVINASLQFSDVALKNYLSRVDFLCGALFIKLGKAPYYIQEAATLCANDEDIARPALESLMNQKIEYVNRSHHCLVQPSCLFRLAKQMLKYPSFELGDEIKRDLWLLHMTYIFRRFLIYEPERRKYQGQVNTALDNLFSRFEFSHVLDALKETKILKGITGFDPNTIDALIKICKQFTENLNEPNAKQLAKRKKERFYFVFVSQFLMTNHPQQLHLWPFYQAARHLPKERRVFYDYLCHKICRSPSPGMYFFSELDSAIAQVEAFNAPPSQRATPLPSLRA